MCWEQRLLLENGGLGFTERIGLIVAGFGMYLSGLGGLCRSREG